MRKRKAKPKPEPYLPSPHLVVFPDGAELPPPPSLAELANAQTLPMHGAADYWQSLAPAAWPRAHLVMNSCDKAEYGDALSLCLSHWGAPLFEEHSQGRAVRVYYTGLRNRYVGPAIGQTDCDGNVLTPCTFRAQGVCVAGGGKTECERVCKMSRQYGPDKFPPVQRAEWETFQALTCLRAAPHTGDCDRRRRYFAGKEVELETGGRALRNTVAAVYVVGVELNAGDTGALALAVELLPRRAPDLYGVVSPSPPVGYLCACQRAGLVTALETLVINDATDATANYQKPILDANLRLPYWPNAKPTGRGNKLAPAPAPEPDAVQLTIFDVPLPDGHTHTLTPVVWDTINDELGAASANGRAIKYLFTLVRETVGRGRIAIDLQLSDWQDWTYPPDDNGKRYKRPADNEIMRRIVDELLTPRPLGNGKEAPLMILYGRDVTLDKRAKPKPGDPTPYRRALLQWNPVLFGDDGNLTPLADGFFNLNADGRGAAGVLCLALYAAVTAGFPEEPADIARVLRRSPAEAIKNPARLFAAFRQAMAEINAADARPLPRRIR